MPKGNSSDQGQAVVESALILPLVIFLALGTLQLFLLLQARLFTQYAAFLAVRTGVVKHGSCDAMLDAAVAALLPTFTRTDSAAALGNAFAARRSHKFAAALDSGHDGDIVWIFREQPSAGSIRADEEDTFDDPDIRGSLATLQRLEVRLVFWYPMRIPFANWVMERMFMANWGIREYHAVNPLLPTQSDANWRAANSGLLDSAVATEVARRADISQYTFPLTASWTMRMMTPARPRYFTSQNCGGAP